MYLTCPFINSNYRDSTNGCQTFSGCFAKKFLWWKKEELHPSRSFLLVCFTIFTVFLLLGQPRERERREKRSLLAYAQLLYAPQLKWKANIPRICSIQTNELASTSLRERVNWNGRNNSSGWIDGSLCLLWSPARVSPSIYRPCSYSCSSLQAFSCLKVAVHDPPGIQCSQQPLFSKWTKLKYLLSFHRVWSDWRRGGVEVNRDGKHLSYFSFSEEESELLPFHMTPVFIIDPKQESVCALSPKINHSTR